MPQLPRTSEPYWIKIRDRIDSTKAAQVVARVVIGDESITPLQASMAWNVVNKLLPSLQAIQLDVTDQRANTINDLQAMALEHGVDPTLLLSPDQGLSEKLDPPEETPARGVAPEDQA